MEAGSEPKNLVSEEVGTAPDNAESKESEKSASKSGSEDGCDDEAGSSHKNLVDSLGHFLKDKLHIGGDKAEKKKKVLPEKSLEAVVKYIEEKKVTKIITMAGAGISTSAGIPDFRSPKTGLYNNLAKYDLPHPHAIFELDFFHKNPKPFFVLAKELFPGSFKPTVSHYFIRMLYDKGILLRHYTQNIDTLERVSGVPGEKIVEAHGTFFTSHCLECELGYDLDWMKEKIFADEIPKCISCGGVVKPDIVFFGENLPSRFFRCVEKDFDECELLIIMGTSLVVQPFASLVDRVGSKIPRLLLNREKAGTANPVMRALGLSGGMDFSSDSNRDVAWLGDCDDGCEALASAFGWADELKGLVAKEHELIDKEESKKGAVKGKI